MIIFFLISAVDNLRMVSYRYVESLYLSNLYCPCLNKFSDRSKILLSKISKNVFLYASLPIKSIYRITDDLKTEKREIRLPWIELKIRI